MPEQKLTLSEKLNKTLQLMDKVCYRLDAVELWIQKHDEHQNKVRKEQIMNTKAFIEDMKSTRSEVVKALLGEVTDMNQVANNQMMFDQRTMDKLTTMIERAELEQGGQKKDIGVAEEWERFDKEFGKDARNEQKNIKGKNELEESETK